MENLSHSFITDDHRLSGIEQKLALLIINTEEPFVIVDRNLEIVTFNLKFQTQYASYFGIEFKKGDSLLNYVKPERIEPLKKIYADAFEGHTSETVIHVASRTFIARYKPALDEHGAIIGCCVIITDNTEKLRSEMLLQANESRFRTFVERISDAFIAFDQNLCYTYVNKKAGEMIRRDPESLIGRHIWDVFPDVVGSATYEAFERAMREQVNIVNTDYYAPLNLWQENHFYPSADGMSLFIRDISRQKIAEEQIRQSERNLRVIFENSAEGFILLDPQGYIKAFNAQANRNDMLDLPFEMQVGRSIYDYLAADKKENFSRLIDRVLGNTACKYDTQYMDKQGRPLWFSVTLSPVIEHNEVVGVCITRSDITARKISEEILRTATERYEMVAKATSDAIWDHDLESGRTYVAGSGYKYLFGYNIVNAFTEPDFWEKRLHHEDRERAMAEMSAAITDENAAQCSIEYRLLKANGDYAYVRDRFFIMRENGRALRMIGAKQDITQQKEEEQRMKQQEQEREKLIHELTQNNSDLRQFSYITSHNLRGPVASLLGLCNLVDNFTIEDPALKQILNGVKKATLMFDETIKDLTAVLNIRDRTSIPREDLNLQPIYEKALTQSEAYILEFGAEISADFSQAPVVHYNKAYMESIFSNLITNALKYRSPLRQLKVSISTEVWGDHLVMRFSDNGLGIDLALNKDKIFKLYQRFHDHAEGKGLGLFLIKSQMEALNGSIDIESSLGEGTAFILKFKNK